MAEFRKFFHSEGIMSTTTIQIRSKGVITLPKDLRRQYRLNEGDILTLVDLGDGFFLLTSQHLPTARLADQVGQVLDEAGATLDDLLQTLDEERERYYQEHYVSG
jgi:AbrB family looped-hinge helix DNA binding protein